MLFVLEQQYRYFCFVERVLGGMYFIPKSFKADLSVKKRYWQEKFLSYGFDVMKEY